MNKFQVKMIGVMLLLMLGIMMGCSSKKAEGPADSITIKGAGSTFVGSLFRKWFEQYHKEHPNVVVDYDIVGSGEGTKRFLEGTVDFGASDAALTDEEIASVKRGAVLIPVTAGSIVLAYSPQGLPPQLKLSRSVYADIFLGKITHWNDPRIAAINPGVTFPDRDIQVVVRNDSSGTTFAFTNHLSAISEEWRQGPGTGKNPSWPAHPARADGNEGVAGSIQRGSGMIGYVHYGTARGSVWVWLGLRTRRATISSRVVPADWKLCFRPSCQAIFACSCLIPMARIPTRLSPIPGFCSTGSMTIRRNSTR